MNNTNETHKPILIDFDERSYLNHVTKLEQIQNELLRVKGMIPDYIETSFLKIIEFNNFHELVAVQSETSITLPIAISEKVKLFCPGLESIKLAIHNIRGLLSDNAIQLNIFDADCKIPGSYYNLVRKLHSTYTSTPEQIEIVTIMERIKTDITNMNTILSKRGKNKLYQYNAFTGQYMRFGTDVDFQLKNLI